MTTQFPCADPQVCGVQYHLDPRSCEALRRKNAPRSFGPGAIPSPAVVPAPVAVPESNAPQGRGFDERKWVPASDVRLSNSKRRKLLGRTYRPFVPGSLSGIDIEKVLTKDARTTVREVEQAILELDRSQVASNVIKSGAIRSLLSRSEAISSSRFENIHAPTQKVLEAQVVGWSKRSASESSIDANVNLVSDSLHEFVDSGDPVTPEWIESLQESLVGTQNDRSFEKVPLGYRFREIQGRDGIVWIGGYDEAPVGADHVGTLPDRLPAAMSDLSDFLNDESVPPLIRGLLGHAQFESIHPFYDGNGRTGRILLQVPLLRSGLTTNPLPVSTTFSRKRRRYIEALDVFRSDVSDEEAYSESLEELALLVDENVEETRQFLEQIVAAKEEYIEQASSLRSNSTGNLIVADLDHHPVVTADSVAERYGIGHTSANAVLRRLEDLGILRASKIKIPRGAPVIAYVADRIVNVIDEFTGGEG